MSIVAIVAEFNPMHYGHKYLIKKAKEITGADTAICIMSGNFTQLGNITLKDKFTRANIAIENGFDAVIELPTIYATSSAEYFCFGAINIINSLNCIDYLCFGSETGDIVDLTNIAKKIIKNNKSMWENITESLKQGVSFAKAREYAISKFLSNDEIKISTTSNNILAIEYIKSLITLESQVKPIAIKRITGKNIASATSIREMINKKANIDDIKKYILNPTKIIDSPILNENLYYIIKYAIISKNKEYLKDINEVTEGLENKIYEEINSSNSYNEFIHNIKSKRYQLSKIKRILINILLDISKDDFAWLSSNKNCYAHILAIRSDIKNQLLSLLNKNSKIPIITSISDNKLSIYPEIVQKSLALDIKSSNIYSIISNKEINKDYTNRI